MTATEVTATEVTATEVTATEVTATERYEKSTLLKSAVNQIIDKFKITESNEDKLFEYFTGYLLSAMHSIDNRLDPISVHSGGGDDQGVDAISIIVNGVVVNDEIDVRSLKYSDDEFDVKYIFVQAKNILDNKNFIANFASFTSGIDAILNEDEKHLDKFSQRIQKFIELKNMVEEILKPKNKPKIYAYYVSAADSFTDDTVDKRALPRYESAKKVLRNIHSCEYGESKIIDGEHLLSIYRKVTQDKKSTKFKYDGLYQVSTGGGGVDEVYIGYLPLGEYLKIIHDDEDNININVFHKNVRSFQGNTNVNSSIKEALDSDSGRRNFFAKNNGVTVTANRAEVNKDEGLMSIYDYNIVNGCQTSYILSDYYRAALDEKKKIEDSVPLDARGKTDSQLFEMFCNNEISGDKYKKYKKANDACLKEINAILKEIEDIKELIHVPLRIVVSEDDELVLDIVRSTNTQNPVKAIQFESRGEFHKNLEEYFKGISAGKLLYESLSGESRHYAPNTKYVDANILLKSFSSVYLKVPHMAARNFGRLTTSKINQIDSIDKHRDIFSEYHNRAAYFLVAKMYVDLIGYVKPENIPSREERGKHERYLWHIIYAMFIELIELMPPSYKKKYLPKEKKEEEKKEEKNKLKNIAERRNSKDAREILDMYLDMYQEQNFKDLYERSYRRFNRALQEFKENNKDIENNEINKNSGLVNYISKK